MGALLWCVIGEGLFRAVVAQAPIALVRLNQLGGLSQLSRVVATWLVTRMYVRYKNT
jgi:hypothetical protein